MEETVSIYMLCYNHSKWVEQAILGVLKQKTNFKFKLYIHDDASTDNTADIIKKYAEKYSEIIVATLQEKNIYSRYGGARISEIISAQMKGKFICCCEGDDYWIDEYKLQKQYDYMSTNTNCTYCFTNAIMVNTESKYQNDFFGHYYWKDKEIIKKLKNNSDFSTEEILKIGFTPTASVMIPRKVYLKTKTFPHQLDLEIRLIATEMGYAHYINEKMTAYRVGNPKSASGSASESFEKYKKEFCNLHKAIYDEFNEFTNYKYRNTVNLVIDRELVLAYVRFLNKNNYKEFIHLKAYADFRVYRKIRYLAKRIIKG